MRRYKLNTMLLVEWDDTVEDPAWQSPDEAGEKPTEHPISLGFFLKSDDKFLYISSTVSETERNSLKIPLGVIRSIKTLR